MNKRMYEVLLAPLISEKATRAGTLENSVAFWIKPDATKPEIKQAVEAHFGVKVEGVHTVRYRGRPVRSAGRTGRSKNRKKAYVKLAPGHEITFANEP